MFIFYVIVSNSITSGICATFIQELTEKVDQNVKDIQEKKEKHQVIFVILRNIIILYHYFMKLSFRN